MELSFEIDGKGRLARKHNIGGGAAFCSWYVKLLSIIIVWTNAVIYLECYT